MSPNGHWNVANWYAVNGGQIVTNDKSANAKFNSSRLVTVRIFCLDKITYITSVFPIMPISVVMPNNIGVTMLKSMCSYWLSPVLGHSVVLMWDVFVTSMT